MGRNPRRRRRVFVYTIHSFRGTTVLLFGTICSRYIRIGGPVTCTDRVTTTSGGVFGHFLWTARDICVRSTRSQDTKNDYTRH